jgi:hypothetical protein
MQDSVTSTLRQPPQQQPTSILKTPKSFLSTDRDAASSSSSSMTPSKPNHHPFRRHLSFGQNSTREISPREYSTTPRKHTSPPKPDLLEYDRSVRDAWLDKEDEEFLQDFATTRTTATASSSSSSTTDRRGGGTISDVRKYSTQHIKQILAVARYRGLLHQLDPQTLDMANRKAWQSVGGHRKSHEAIIKQIDMRLQKEYDNA